MPTFQFFLFYFILICLIYRFEKATIANAKQNVTLDVLSYHASASLEDAQRLRVSIIINLLSVYYFFEIYLNLNFTPIILF